MKQGMKLLLILFVFSCAVQGPIPGGEVDKSGPKLIKVYPENNSTTIQDNEKITLFFNEAIDPNSVYDSFQISSSEYKIRVTGKKVIIRPKEKWDRDSILKISISRDLTDYYKNSINSSLDFHFSMGKEIPKGIITGSVLDIVDIIEKYNDANYESNIYEVALYQKLDSDMVQIAKTQTNADLKFNFSGVDTGSYSILVIKDGIYNPIIDITQREFGIYNSSVQIDEENLEHDILINIGDPISKNNISSIDFINNYFINYNFTDGSSQLGIVDTVINNIDKNLSGTRQSVQINLENNFESYLTDVFEFVIPSIKDTIAPKIISCEIVDSLLSIRISEPLQECCIDSALYIYDNYETIPLEGLSYNIHNDPLQINQIVLPVDRGYQDSLSLYIASNLMKDFSGNTMIDSALQIKDCNKTLDNKPNSKFDSGGLSGEIITSNTKELVVVAYNIQTKQPWRSIVDGENFHFDNLPSGEYFLQAYENYSTKSGVTYPYFAGSWSPFKPSVYFSEFIGPVEIRKNWDIDGIKIKFD